MEIYRALIEGEPGNIEAYYMDRLAMINAQEKLSLRELQDRRIVTSEIPEFIGYINRYSEVITHMTWKDFCDYAWAVKDIPEYEKALKFITRRGGKVKNEPSIPYDVICSSDCGGELFNALYKKAIFTYAQLRNMNVWCHEAVSAASRKSFKLHGYNIYVMPGGWINFEETQIREVLVDLYKRGCHAYDRRITSGRVADEFNVIKEGNPSARLETTGGGLTIVL